MTIKNEVIIDKVAKNERVIDSLPKQGFVERTSSIFQATSTTYNDPTVLYNDTAQTYGGADTFSGAGPKMNDILLT